MTRHKVRLWELLLHWGASFLCFSDTEALVRDQCLILPNTMKSKMFFTVFTFINRNRMCSSKWWHVEGKPTGYWTGHFKLKKDKKGFVFKCCTSVLLVLRDSDFYHFFSVANSLLFIFRHEISYWNQLQVYNLCWVPTTEKNFWGHFSGIVCWRLLPPQWSN